MIARIIALLLLLSVSYVLWVFLAPDFMDIYGDSDINAKIREYKDLSLRFSSGASTPESLVEQITRSSQVYIDETRRTYENIENTISGKIQDVQVAADSVQKAYEAINEAKSDIQNVIQSVSWVTIPNH